MNIFVCVFCVFYGNYPFFINEKYGPQIKYAKFRKVTLRVIYLNNLKLGRHTNVVTKDYISLLLYLYHFYWCHGLCWWSVTRSNLGWFLVFHQVKLALLCSPSSCAFSSQNIPYNTISLEAWQSCFRCMCKKYN